MITRASAAVLLILVLGRGLPFLGQTQKEDKDIQGEWELKALIKNGEDKRKDASQRTDEKTLLIFKDDTLTFKTGPSERKGKLSYDSTQMPMSLDFTATDGNGKEHTTLGIYELKSDELHICFAEPDKDRPKEFTGEKGTGCSLWTLRRVKE